MITFRTNKIRVRKGEDERINHRCYGMYLAKDIRDSLRKLGYQAMAGTEDWGWYIVIRTKPYFQWIGCRNITEIDLNEDASIPENIEWGLTVENECGLWHRFKNRHLVKRETASLQQRIIDIVSSRYAAEIRIE